jgi:hypothetical protein
MRHRTRQVAPRFLGRCRRCVPLARALLLISCFLASSGAENAAAEDVFLEDHFPGYAEDSNWDYSWNVGIGSTSFDAASPGFAHLNLAGPWSAPPPAYQNAEIIRHSVAAYRDFEVRLRNSNNNGWDAPGAPDDPDPTYGLGSRGWGFWDTNTTSVQDAIWFTSISPESSPVFRGSRIFVVHGGLPVIVQDMNIDLTEWHTYRIQWRQDAIRAFIDDMETPVAEVTNPGSIPSTGLTFTIWVDNYAMTGDLSDYTLGYLDVPAMDQFIDVDYAKIYVPDPESSLPALPLGWLAALAMLLLAARTVFGLPQRRRGRRSAGSPDR